MAKSGEAVIATVSGALLAMTALSGVAQAQTADICDVEDVRTGKTIPVKRLAPEPIVDIIESNFRDSDYRLTETVSIDGPEDITYVGGNIRNSAGERKYSANTWVLVDGQVYSLSSGALSQSFLPDGRKLEQTNIAGNEWTSYNDAVYKCELQRTRRSSQN